MELKKTRSLGISYFTKPHQARFTPTSTKVNLKHENSPFKSTFVNTIDNSKDDLNKPSYEDLDVSKQNLKNSIQQRMIDKLNSSEESFNARKMSKVKLHEKGEIDKPTMLKSSGPISKDKQSLPAASLHI
ncbi:ADM_HP2_G0042300.mRNA.1.CDS.1 [Saccharomyces cerevisiae]|nr:ADM_HP2_G0042300.mRNA.1.CDS.1 [Saccharomyces cerevisiae]CAI6635678.1 ADM_HP2_G0042300.mRNA.1.CDS.1 [Saccharomyces cerevisiae]